MNAGTTISRKAASKRSRGKHGRGARRPDSRRRISTHGPAHHSASAERPFIRTIPLNQSIESIRDTVATAISVNLSMVTLQENETMKRLAAYAALIAVPTMIAGIYGMNFEHMPELGWKYGYAVAVGVMAIIDCYLFYRLRKAKWL